MYLLLRLLEAFVASEISTKFFSEEFNLVYSRYEGLDEIEINEFGVKYSEDLEKQYSKLNYLCSSYYHEVNEEDIKKYGYTSIEVLKKESVVILNKIKEEKMIRWGNVSD